MEMMLSHNSYIKKTKSKSDRQLACILANQLKNLSITTCTTPHISSTVHLISRCTTPHICFTYIALRRRLSPSCWCKKESLLWLCCCLVRRDPTCGCDFVTAMTLFLWIATTHSNILGISTSTISCFYTIGRKCYADGQYLTRRPFIGVVGIGPGLGRGQNSAVGLGMPSA
jgi:hypothetical protein